MTMPGAPSASIIIPTKNRPLDLCRVCASVWTQTFCAQELIIVDQSQTQESRAMVEKQYGETPLGVRERLKLNYIWDPVIPGAAVAKNRGMKVATGDIWILLDDDVILERDFVEQLLATFVSFPAAVGVSGVVTNYAPPARSMRMWNAIFMHGLFRDTRQPVYWHADELRNNPPLKVPYLGSGLAGFRAAAVRGVKFDDTLRGVPGGEDIEFCARLGRDALLLITAKARLVHNQSPAGREQVYWLERHARAWTYLYTRNWRRGTWNRVCFIWLNIGYAFIANLLCLRKGSLEPWRSLLAGARTGRLYTCQSTSN